MNLKLKKRLDEQTKVSSSDQDAGEESVTGCSNPANVAVSCGIHGGRYPIGGMRIRDARQVLSKLINIPSEAVPVINGTAVDEDETITEQVTMLSFVKPSSLKG
jgi:hypothetical protein